MIILLQIPTLAKHLFFQFLPIPPTNGTVPPTEFTAALELAFVAGGALLALLIVLKDPIYPKSRKAPRSDESR